MPEGREDLETQVQVVIRALEGGKFGSDSPVFVTVLKWIKNFPGAIDIGLKEKLKHNACEAFDLTEAQLLAAIEGVILPTRLIFTGSEEDKFRAMLPKRGWFEWYDEYTRYNEAPLSYHVFASLCILGSALGRRVHFNMGHFNIWPNYCVIMVGPTGKVKKTTAADIAREFVKRHSLCPMMSDEPSPQALTSEMVKTGGHQFVYAGEMSVFFGKDKFKEAMIPKFLRMLDSPESYEVDTISRNKETVLGLAISFLGGTTQSLFQSAMPTIVTSSGFMNRFIFVVEQRTDRVFPRPWVGRNKEILDSTLNRFKKLEGVVDFAPGVEGGWWDNWYRARRKLIEATPDDSIAEVTERMPGHLLRTAMLIHLVQCDNFQLCEKCLDHARLILEYCEKSTPGLVSSLKQSAIANEADFVYHMLTRLGGAADHSTLLRRCAPKMNAQQFKGHIRTLEEQGKIKSSKRGFSQFYIIIEEVTKLAIS